MISLGFGHPLPIWLAIVGVIDIAALPFLLTAYVREALGPHASDVVEVEVEVPERTLPHVPGLGRVPELEFAGTVNRAATAKRRAANKRARAARRTHRRAA